MHMQTPTHNPSLERQAQRRASAQFGWLIHAGVYLAVNTGLLDTLLGLRRGSAARVQASGLEAILGEPGRGHALLKGRQAGRQP